MNTPFRPSGSGPGAPGPGRVRLRRDLWDRLIFAPPELANPRAIFDPVPFRSAPPFGRWDARTAGRR